jgi:hypothetical protein
MSRDETVQCIRCDAQMEVGYVPDATEYGWAQQMWHPGTPQRSWRGLKGMKKNQCVPVTTLRCPTCGYLESYAVPGTLSDR